MNSLRTLALTLEERQRAQRVSEIGARGDAGLPELIALLDDPSWGVRRAVVAALAHLGNAAASSLCELLVHRRDNEARLAATVDALVALRGDVDGEVLRLTASSDPAVVCDAAQVLGRRRSVAAVPTLAGLTTGEDDNVALAAIEALGRIGDEASIAPLIASVESRSFFRTFPAIDVLGRSGSARAVKPLVTMLAEPVYVLEAARALGRIGDPASIPSLLVLLAKPNDAIVRVAAVALTEIQDKRAARFGGVNDTEAALARIDLRTTTRRIIQCLNRADPAEQAALCRALGWIGGEGAALALVDMLSADAAAAQVAATALIGLGKAAEPQLLQALRHATSEQRLMILPLLSHRASVAESVAQCLSDLDPKVRGLACDALARIGETRFVPEIFALLGDPDARVTQRASAAIQSLGSAETERLALEAAVSSDPRVRRAGLRIIAYFGYPSGLDVLVQAMGDADERIRDAAIFGLPFIDEPRALAALHAAASHASPRTRAAAMRAIGQANKAPRGIAALRSGLRDPDPWVRYFACQSLSRLKDEESAELIAPLLDDPAGQVRVAVVEALAQLRGARALDALHGAASGGDADVQRAALLGLGMVKSDSSLPVLRDAVHAVDSATRLVALSALAEYTLPEVAIDLGAALSDADDSVRGAALALLASRPGIEAARVLVAELANRPMRDRVVAALAQPAPRRVEVIADALRTASADTAPSLVSALARMQRSEAAFALEDAFASSEVVVRRAVAPALAAIGSPSARALLSAAAAGDEDDEVRRVSAATLEP